MSYSIPNATVAAPGDRVIHVVLFDVSASMQAPLKLRSNAKDANQGSGKLEPKRVDTVFDVIYRLAEDGISESRNQDLYAAILCFGLLNVDTCDFLAFLAEQLKILEALDIANDTAATELSYSRASALLAQYGFGNYEIAGYLQKVPTSRTGTSSRSEQLYRVIGRAPLVRLLNRQGAAYCEQYVERHTSPEAAGRYFMAFASPSRANDLQTLVARLPSACKDHFSISRNTVSRVPVFNIVMEDSAASQAIYYAEDIIRQAEATQSSKPDISDFLKTIPFARERPLKEVLDLIKRLQVALCMRNTQRDQGHGSLSSQANPDSSLINWEGLLDDIEPHLYGYTPMCAAFSSLQRFFIEPASSKKVIILISDGGATDGDPLPLAKAIRDAGGVIFACFLTESPIQEPRRLRGADEDDQNWSRATRCMFNMSSTASWDSGAVQALRRRGWKLPQSGQCKLFIQANNPIIIDEFTTASRNMGTCSDSLAEMVGQVPLDDYIRKSNNDAKVTDQNRRFICWAHATGTVIHLASKRILGREVQDFWDIRSHLLSVFGDNDDGQGIDRVLRYTCPTYKLRYKRCDAAGARDAIHGRRPVVAAFWLDESRWDDFRTFYEHRPKETLTVRDMDSQAAGKLVGHAAVLVRCDETSLTFMNSWGPEFANNGFFSVDKAATLEVAGGHRMRFYDVYWTTDDLSDEEVVQWETYRGEKVGNLIGVLPKSFHDLPVDCPHCGTSAPANKYDGSWNEARCRTCNQTFKPTVRGLLQSLYEKNYTPLSSNPS